MHAQYHTVHLGNHLALCDPASVLSACSGMLVMVLVKETMLLVLLLVMAFSKLLGVYRISLRAACLN